MSHRPLGSLAPADVLSEILDSRASLEDIVGRAVRSFAYPYGDAPPLAARTVREHFHAGFGIRLACATRRSRRELFERIDAFYVRREPPGRARRSGRQATSCPAALRAVRHAGAAGYRLA